MTDLDAIRAATGHNQTSGIACASCESVPSSVRQKEAALAIRTKKSKEKQWCKLGGDADP
jgi:hypothetical protein